MAVALSATTVLLLLSEGPWTGAVLLSVSDGHGLHVGDLGVLAVWALGLAACVGLWSGRRR